MTWEAALIGGTALVAVIALVLGVVVYRRQKALLPVVTAGRTADDSSPAATTAGRGDLVAFVANPSKPDVPALRETVRAACAERYLPEPLWLETTEADPGVGQAREAVRRGADVVVALGGDGTVRAVAEALVGTGVPMGLMPMGTGNLLARNLDIPISDPSAAVRIALEGRNRTIDVGWLTIDRDDSGRPEDTHLAADAHWPTPHVTRSSGSLAGSGAGSDESTGGSTAAPSDDDTATPVEHIFLVIAGLGFDAAMVADTDADLKARVGWIAYFVSGFRHLHGKRTKVHLRLDSRPPVTTRLRSLLIGNCGKLPGGITLIPDAVLDDGWLDIAAIDTRGGLAGWVQLLGEVVLQGYGVRTELPAKIGRIDHARARTIRVLVPGGEQVQVDGDVVGAATAISAWVDPGALVVRVPEL